MGNMPFAIIMFIAIVTGPFAVWAMDKVFKPNQSKIRMALFFVGCAAASFLTVWVLSHGAKVVLN